MRQKQSNFERSANTQKYEEYFKDVPTQLTVNDRITEVTVELYDTFSTRLKGLMFRRAIPENFGIRMSNCSAIHMFFVRFPLDIVFCDKHGIVVSIFPNFTDKMTRSQKKFGAHFCYEFKAGIIAKEEIQVGDHLALYQKLFLRHKQNITRL